MGSTSESGDDAETCVACGECVEDAVHRRVVSRIEDGQAVNLQFCNDECLAEWQDE